MMQLNIIKNEANKYAELCSKKTNNQRLFILDALLQSVTTLRDMKAKAAEHKGDNSLMGGERRDSSSEIYCTAAPLNKNGASPC